MRGQGRVFRPKVRGRETIYWWLDYSVHGSRHREPTRTKIKADAQRLLRQRLTEREDGRVVGRPDRLTFTMLRELAERQYQLDGRRSLARLRIALQHLEDALGSGARATDITAARLDSYAASRLGEGVCRSTVNYELAAMRRAFRLAMTKGLLATMPVIRLPAVRNARRGFFEDGDFAALVLELPADIQSVVRFLRLTGWRRSEALGLTWNQVDFEGSTIRLAPEDTKGGDGRVFPFGLAPDLKQLLAAQHASRDGIFVFHRAGQRIGGGALRSSWRRACRRVGLEGRLVHDLRRSAARDFRRAGVSEGEIMKLCGWKTRAMFDRYNIIDEQDLARAVAKRFGKQAANDGGGAQGGEKLTLHHASS